MNGRAVLAVCLVLAAVVPAAGVGSAQSGEEEIVRTATLSLTPETPGEISVTVDYDVPDPVTELNASLPSEAVTVRADGFERAGGEYRWTGRADPTLTFRLPVNRTTTAGRSDGIDTGTGLSFVDAGPWAIAPVPSLSTGWAWRGESIDVTLRREARVAGEGAVGDAMAYLGSAERYERRAAGQDLVLVVPEAASLAPTPEDVLDALAAAAELRLGARDERVLMVAAPTGPDWGPAGLQYGDNAAWVRADERLNDAANTWIHEYVHTRQAFAPASSARWLTEGSARYYAARVALDAGLVDFGDFRRALERGSEPTYADAVLADPDTWGDGAQYAKGALVAGDLDRRLRASTEGEVTLDSVVAQLNAVHVEADPLTAAALVEAVGAGSASVREPVRRYTRTSAVPEAWDATAHDAAFGIAVPRFAIEPTGEHPFEVRGPYRNGSYASLPALAVGETLSVETAVENVGTAGGAYNATLWADERALDSAEGSLDSGASTTVTLTGTPDAPAGTLRVGTTELGAGVRPAAPVNVTDLALDGRAENGSVVLVATVAAPADTPAGERLAVTVNGSRVAERAVALAPGERRTLRYYLDLDPGEHRVEVGNRVLVVTVPEGATGTPGASLGVLPALAALALLVVALRVKR